MKEKDGVRIDQRKTEPLTITRGIARIRVAPELLFSLIRSPEHLKKCDKRYKSSTRVHVLDDEHHVSQFLYKFPTPLKDRDFVIFEVGRSVPSGALVSCSSSVVWEVEIPKSHVRCFIQRSGYMIQSADEGRASIVTWMAQLDPGGSIPKAVANMQSSAPLILATIRTWVESKAASSPAIMANPEPCSAPAEPKRDDDADDDADNADEP